MGGKKIMGLPLAVWLGVAAGGLLLGIYLRRKGGSQSTAIGAATSFPLSDPNAGLSSSLDSGIAGGGISPASGAGVDPSVFSDLIVNEGAVAAQLGSLTDAIGQLVYNVPSSGGAGASGSGKDPYLTTTESSAPAAPAVQPPTPKPLPKVVARRPPAPAVRYYTYKRNVPLVGGKTLHFTKGKGYYAA